jgi:hypothetical protein
MLKWAFYVVSWVCCVLFFGLIVGRPEELGVALRGFGVSATIVDIFFADRSVQWVGALSVAFLFGYAVPSAISRLLHLAKLRKLDAALAGMRHEPRSLDELENLVQQDGGLLQRLSPVGLWVYGTSREQGDSLLVAKCLPSTLVTSAQLARTSGLTAALRFLPLLLVLLALIIVMLALARSSDKAFAEVLSVANTDYGTMILGLRSATGAMAIALFAAVLVWATEKLLDFKAQSLAQSIASGLDQLVTLEDRSAMDLPMPINSPAPIDIGKIEQLLGNLQTKIGKTETALHDLSKAQVSGATMQTIHNMLKSSESKQDMMLRALQQSMDELHGLRKEVDAMQQSTAQPLPTPSNDLAASRLTSAIRALKDSAASDLPQL